MPPPIGGAFALSRVNNRSNFPSTSTSTLDLSDVAFKETKVHFNQNLKCEIDFHQEVISSSLGTIHGALSLQSKKEILHSGIFILMKGLHIAPKQRQMGSKGFKLKRSLKFVIVPHDTEGIKLDEDSHEFHQFEMKLPRSHDGLPPPIITADGKLLYRLEVFMSSSEENQKHVKIEETRLRYEGYLNLHDMEEKPLLIREELQVKKSYLPLLGKGKVVNLELSADRNGYLSGEVIAFVIEAQSDFDVDLDLTVTLLQKVWYQVTNRDGRGRESGMKIHEIVSTTMQCLPLRSEKNDSDGSVGHNGTWEGFIEIPEGISPSYKSDFLNSINYNLKVVATVSGKADISSEAEHPITIGTTRKSEDSLFVKKDYGDRSPSEGSSANVSISDISDVSDGGLGAAHRGGMQRQRSVSLSSVRTNQSRRWFRGGSVWSLLKHLHPPTYSQLSSRRSTLETLPPPYSDLTMG